MFGALFFVFVVLLPSPIGCDDKLLFFAYSVANISAGDIPVMLSFDVLSTTLRVAIFDVQIPMLI